MSRTFSLDDGQYEAYAAQMGACGPNAERAVNEELRDGESGEDIYLEINEGIHPSGRVFKGHRGSAKRTRWPVFDTSRNLTLTVTTKGKFAYLYFPDDGSNTENHQGGQDFFGQGLRRAVPRVLDRCMNAAIKSMEE